MLKGMLTPINCLFQRLHEWWRIALGNKQLLCFEFPLGADPGNSKDCQQAAGRGEARLSAALPRDCGRTPGGSLSSGGMLGCAPRRPCLRGAAPGPGRLPGRQRGFGCPPRPGRAGASPPFPLPSFPSCQVGPQGPGSAAASPPPCAEQLIHMENLIF